MTFGAIDSKGKKYYTYLKEVFESINNKQLDYNWLITDCECYPTDPEVAKVLDQEYCWVSGEQLTELVLKGNFQWIWADLSAFKKSVELSEVLQYDLPYANGYKGFWVKPISMQHPLAQMEIVAWDSALTLLFSKDSKDIDSFLRYFPSGELLEDYIDKL